MSNVIPLRPNQPVPTDIIDTSAKTMDALKGSVIFDAKVKIHQEVTRIATLAGMAEAFHCLENELKYLADRMQP